MDRNSRYQLKRRVIQSGLEQIVLKIGGPSAQGSLNWETELGESDASRWNLRRDWRYCMRKKILIDKNISDVLVKNG